MRPGTRKALRWLWVIPALIAIAAIAFVVWGLTPLGPTDLALEALKSGNGVTVTPAAGGWAFSATGKQPTVGLVFYPGGHVDARSYAPLAREIARRGYLVVVPKMPLSLAFLDLNAADKAIASFPRVTTWVVGGHSLGGVAAAAYASGHLSAVKGLVLFASYPASGTDLSASKLVVTSNTGTRDEVIDRTALTESYGHLPAGSDTAAIEGGNHGQFGSYGPQPGDGVATIAPEEQWRLAGDHAQAVLESAGAR
jgi:pimeloyl-ACP methyl ester carboxylesterase